MFSMAAVPFRVPAGSVQRSSFSTSSPALIRSLSFSFHFVFDNSHSHRCEVTSHCGFDLHFSDDYLR